MRKDHCILKVIYDTALFFCTSGKDPATANTEDYWSIALTSHVGMTMERRIKEKVNMLIED